MVTISASFTVGQLLVVLVVAGIIISLLVVGMVWMIMEI